VVQDGQGIPTDAALDAISSDAPSGSDAIAMSDSRAETDGNVDAGDGAAADASEASTTAPDTGADKCSAYTSSTPVANGTYAIESNAGFYLDDPSAGGSGTSGAWRAGKPSARPRSRSALLKHITTAPSAPHRPYLLGHAVANLMFDKPAGDASPRLPRPLIGPRRKTAVPMASPPERAEALPAPLP
jgi:hypothetical protein